MRPFATKRGGRRSLISSNQTNKSKQSSKSQRQECSLESLERRQMLADATNIAGGRQIDLPPEASYVGAEKFFYKVGGYLTKPTAGDARDIAMNWVKSNAAAFGLAATDVRSIIVADYYHDTNPDMHRVYLKQTINGLQVKNAEMAVMVTPDGRILSAGGNFVSLPKKIDANPTLPITTGLQKAAEQLQLTTNKPTMVVQPPIGSKKEAKLRNDGLSRTDIPAQAHYVATSKGVRLAWQYSMDLPSGTNWYTANVDASTGELLFTTDHVSYYIQPGKELDFGDGRFSIPKKIGSSPAPSGSLNSAPPPTYNASYNVFGLPLANPYEGPRFIANNPWDLGPSPFGWHDLDGDDGAETSDSTGNNVSAQEDRDNNNTGGIKSQGGTLNPDGSGNLNFDTPLDLTLEPTTPNNQLSAVTNLFYWNNVLHDLYYKNGFTESARNFQQNNYGLGGVGNDRVQADAQDGSGTNNANFASNTDGTSGRMQMYLFTAPTPDRDGDFDAEIISHELAHGVSNRMSGTGSGLTAVQSRGMGEGWGDYFGLMFTLTDGSVAAQNLGYGVGTYALGQAPDGLGVRRQRYSYDMTKNTQTFGWYGTGGSNGGSTQVHNTGELWASALWDMSWNLIRKHGFNPNIAQGYTGTQAGNGNTLAVKLVMEGIKTHGANPSFIAARDAIIAADQALTGGSNFRELWLAFARRGLGFSANTTGSTATSFNEAFDLPPAFKPFITGHTPQAVADTPTSSMSFSFSKAMDPASFSVVDDVLSFTGPGGNLMGTITGFSWTNTTTLKIDFAPQRANGVYNLTLGANILSADNGTPLDNNANDVAGEPDDFFEGIFNKTGSVGPRVTSQTPSGPIVQPTISTIDVIFSEPMDPASFDVASDIVTFTGPGAVNLKPAISAANWQTTSTLRLTFATQGTDGTYTLVLGPSINASVDSSPMDQNANGTGGEPVNDRYTGTVSLDRFPGPDGSGYEATPETFVPMDLVIGGAGVTSVVNGSDDAAGTITLPAGNSFTFYGQNYTSLFPNANGLIAFGSSTTAFTNGDMTTTPAQAAIAIAWDDWRTDQTGPAPATDSAVLWKIDGNKLIVEWSDVTNRTAANGTATFQAILNLNTGSRNGDIIGNYVDMSIANATYNEGASSTVGIKNSGTQGANRLLVQQNVTAGAFMGTGKAVRFSSTSAAGQLFRDNNGNGVVDGGETGVANVRVYSDENNNGLLDVSELSAFTDGSGNYLLTSMREGNNNIRMQDVDWINTTAGGVALLMGEAGTGRHVGVFDTQIDGTAGADTINIGLNGAGDRLEISSSFGPSYSILKTQVPKLGFHGTTGADVVNVSFGNGDPFAAFTSQFRFTGSDDTTINFTGAGAFTYSTDPANDTPSLAVNSSTGATVHFAAPATHLRSLAVNTGGAADVPTGGDKVLVLSDLLISGGLLDLFDNDLIVKYTGTSPAAGIQAAINAARNGGPWNGSAGITSTAAKNANPANTTLGVLEKTEYDGVNASPFAGETVTGNAVYVKYTYYGDTDFNGAVNFDDYSRVDGGFLNSRTGWLNGDSNGDGVINFDDYALIDGAFLSQTGIL